MKAIAFWALDATVLFSLSLLYLYQGFHRKNQVFAWWLFVGVLMQLVGAWGLAAGRPVWTYHVRLGFDATLYGLTIAVLVVAVLHRDCPVNRSLLWGLGAMVALNVFAVCLGGGVDKAARVWLRNIAFFGPAVFLLIAFSNIKLDRLPLWVESALRTTASEVDKQPAVAAVSLPQLPLKPGRGGEM